MAQDPLSEMLRIDRRALADRSVIAKEEMLRRLRLFEEYGAVLRAIAFGPEHATDAEWMRERARIAIDGPLEAEAAADAAADAFVRQAQARGEVGD